MCAFCNFCFLGVYRFGCQLVTYVTFFLNKNKNVTIVTETEGKTGTTNFVTHFVTHFVTG